jgi:hypothetical protein
VDTLRDKVAYRLKALVLAAGLLGIGLLEWATTAPEVEQGLEHAVPPQLVPLVPVVLGGIATLIAMERTTNTPLPSSVVPPTVVAPTPAADPVERVGGTPAPAMPAAAYIAPQPVAPSAAPAAAGAPFWAGVPAGEPTASTSLVQLQSIPTSSPL